MADRFVIDNSIVMTWCFSDETNSYADEVLNHLSEAVAFVPAIWPLEVVNVLLVAERKNRIQIMDSLRFLHLLSQLPITVDRAWTERIMKDLLALGRENDLSSYDAAYLELAIRLGLPIASTDQKLVYAAQKTGIVLY